jgi:hypothetical protein
MIAVINVCLKCDFHIVHVLRSRFQRFVQRKNEVLERLRAWLTLGRRSVIHVAHLGIPIPLVYVIWWLAEQWQLAWRTLKQFVGFIKHFQQPRDVRICGSTSCEQGGALVQKQTQFYSPILSLPIIETVEPLNNAHLEKSSAATSHWHCWVWRATRQ